MSAKNEPSVQGLDLVDERPDYSKTWEENWEIYRHRYFEVYGEYPPEPGKSMQDSNSEE